MKKRKRTPLPALDSKDEELMEVLEAISVVAKRLSKKLSMCIAEKGGSEHEAV